VNLIDVTGVVNDSVGGPLEPQVTVNGQAATVVNGSFMLADVALVNGPNTITAQATDAVGNTSSASITVVLRQTPGLRITRVSGAGQTGEVTQSLPQPLVVRVQDAVGNPAAGRMVTFRVTRSDGTLRLDSSGPPVRTVQAITDGSGTAQALLTLGSSSGQGNNRVVATALGAAGQVEFCAGATAGQPARIVADMGANQRAAAGQPLPEPLEAAVVDEYGNPLAGVDVTFSVVQGGGNLSGFIDRTIPTGSDGIARTPFAVGFEPGITNNTVTAEYEGLTGVKASFSSSALV
jgi:hypothetical protein